MKRIIPMLFLIIAISSVSLFAQKQLQTPQPKAPVLKPTVLIADLFLVIQTLESVEITGNEVEAFLQAKNTLNGFLQDQQNANKRVTDSIKIELPLPVAQNTMSFLSRAKISGKVAEQFKRFVDAIVESSKAIKND